MKGLVGLGHNEVVQAISEAAAGYALGQMLQIQYQQRNFLIIPRYQNLT
jgi:hypothetical protein